MVVNATEVQHLIETKEVVKLIPQKPIPQRTVQEMEAVPIQMQGKIVEPIPQEVSGSMVEKTDWRMTGKPKSATWKKSSTFFQVSFSGDWSETTKAVKIIDSQEL